MFESYTLCDTIQLQLLKTLQFISVFWKAIVPKSWTVQLWKMFGVLRILKDIYMVKF